MILISLFLTAHAHKNTPEKPTVTYQDIQWDSMVKTINSVADEFDGDVGIYIKDLKTGQIYERRADQPFVCASLIKVPIMLAAFRAIQENKFSLDNTIKLKRSYIRSGSGDLQYNRVGRTYRLYDVMYKMMTRSDNTAAAIFIDKLGYEYINKVCEDMGLSTTRIHPMGMSIADRIDDPSMDNYTTAHEMGVLLERIYRRDLVSDGGNDLMLEIMKHAEGRARLARFLPKTWTLARKGGLVRKNCHDVGIVFTPKSDYVMCVLTRHDRTYKKAIGIIANIGQKAYSFMGNS